MLDEIINYVQSLQQQVEVRIPQQCKILETLKLVWSQYALKEVLVLMIMCHTAIISSVFVYETCDGESRNQH